MSSKSRRVSFRNGPNNVFGVNGPNRNLTNSRKSISIKRRSSMGSKSYNAKAAAKMAELNAAHNSPANVLNAINAMKNSNLKTTLSKHAKQLYKKPWFASVFTRKKNARNTSARLVGQSIIARLKVSNTKRDVEHKAEIFLRENGINPANSSLSVLQQAQLFTQFLGALDKKGLDLHEVLCKGDAEGYKVRKSADGIRVSKGDMYIVINVPKRACGV